MTAAVSLIALAACLAPFAVRARNRRLERKAREAILRTAIRRLQAMPRIVTVYDAPLTAEQSERLQTLIGFQAAMGVLSRRTSWRPTKNVEIA